MYAANITAQRTTRHESWNLGSGCVPHVSVANSPGSCFLSRARHKFNSVQTWAGLEGTERNVEALGLPAIFELAIRLSWAGELVNVEFLQGGDVKVMFLATLSQLLTSKARFKVRTVRALREVKRQTLHKVAGASARPGTQPLHFYFRAVNTFRTAHNHASPAIILRALGVRGAWPAKPKHKDVAQYPTTPKDPSSRAWPFMSQLGGAVVANDAQSLVARIPKSPQLRNPKPGTQLQTPPQSETSVQGPMFLSMGAVFVL